MEVLDGGVDLLEATVASAQGEQDPRCLLSVFRAARSLVRLLADGPPQHAARLKEVLMLCCSSGSGLKHKCFTSLWFSLYGLQAWSAGASSLPHHRFSAPLRMT